MNGCSYKPLCVDSTEEVAVCPKLKPAGCSKIRATRTTTTTTTAVGCTRTVTYSALDPAYNPLVGYTSADEVVCGNGENLPFACATTPVAAPDREVVNEGDIFSGNRFTGDITASCCDSLVVNAERYGSAADAATGTSPIAYTQTFITAADCASSTWETTNMAAGWYKFYACVTKGAFSCCVTEDGQLLNPPPYGSPGAVNYATWPTHRVN